jgi:aldehyde dehydrogenase (NAD+)
MQQATMNKPDTKRDTPRPYGDLDRLPIAGKWRHGKDKGRIRDEDPYTREVLLEIPQADRGDLDAAYAGAAAAQRDWAAALPLERAAVMRQAAQIMQTRQEEIVSWLIREAGSVRIKAQLEWWAVQAVLLEASGMPYLTEGRILPSDVPGKECRAYRKPVGVVGVISPWNWPMQLTARSLAPALAVGNAVVVKPASDTPVTGGLLLARIFEEAGLPPGVLSVVVGAGSEIGDPFVTHAVPRVISFTGSTPVGRHIAELAAKAPIIKRLELELGGNSPFVVLDDADLDQTVAAAVFGKFLHQGQICMIANRFVVDARVYDDFLDRFVARVKSLRIGDPNAPDTMIGPLINEKQLEGLRRRIAEARQAGIREVLGGEPQGLVLPPHIFADVPNDAPLARNELFGPVAPVIRARDAEDALRIANDTEYGLSSAVFTRDIERGTQFALRLEAGMAHVNDQPVNDLPNNPFGGEKNSGIGRFGGIWAVEAFSTDQWVTVQHLPRQYPIDARDIAGPWAGG